MRGAQVPEGGTVPVLVFRLWKGKGFFICNYWHAVLYLRTRLMALFSDMLFPGGFTCTIHMGKMRFFALCWVLNLLPGGKV